MDRKVGKQKNNNSSEVTSNVVIIRSGAADFGLTAASGEELGLFGIEASGGTENSKIKNVSLVGSVNIGGGSPFEVHAGLGNKEVIWEGTQKEFLGIVAKGSESV